MNLLFYRAKYGTLLDHAVAWWTGGPYSHVEIQFSDGMCFSSSPRDGGTRFKRINVNPLHWTVVPVNLPPNMVGVREEANVRRWCAEHINRPFDYLGAFGIALGHPAIEERRWWYCSEICSAVLRQQGLWLFPWNSTPNTMFKEH